MGNKQAQVDPKEAAKQQKRTISRSQRQLEREIKALERQEAKTMREIKKLATAGQHQAAKILSKDVGRNRATRNQYRTMCSNLTVMQNQITSMQMNQNIMGALSGSTTIMQAVNADMNPQQMMNVMKEFNKEMEKAGIQSEMMMDGMEMMEDPNAGAEAEDVYNGILGEIGLEYTSGQAAVPTKALAAPAGAEEVKEDGNDELEARLAALKM